jgi:hypothetical protein
VAEPRAGLLAYDLAAEGRAEPLPSLLGAGLPSDIALAGRLAYAVEPLLGLTVLDFGAAGGPRVVASDPVARSSDRLQLDGNRAYAWQAESTSRYGPQHVSIYERGADDLPVVVGRISLQPAGFLASGDYLYAANYGRLLTYDASDPTHPRLASERDLPQSTRYWLAATPGMLYLVTGDDPTVVSYVRSLPNRPRESSRLRLTAPVRLTDLLATEAILYGYTANSLKALVDLRTPLVPRERPPPLVDGRLIAPADVPGTFWALNLDRQVVRLDFTDLEAPRATGVLLPELRVTDLAVAGDRMLLNIEGGELTLVGLGAAATPEASASPPPSPTAETVTPAPSATLSTPPSPTATAVDPAPRRSTVFLPLSHAPFEESPPSPALSTTVARPRAPFRTAVRPPSQPRK